MIFPATAVLLDDPNLGEVVHFGVIVSHQGSMATAYGAPDVDSLHRLTYDRYVREFLDFTDPEEIALSDLAVLGEDYPTAVTRWFDEHGMMKNDASFLYVASAALEV